MVLEAARAAACRVLPVIVELIVGFLEAGTLGALDLVAAVGAAKLRALVLLIPSAEEAFLAATVEGALSASGFLFVGTGFDMTGACCLAFLSA